MNIDLQNETLITLAQAAELFPRNAQAKRVHVETLRRWIRRGRRGRKLEALRMGGRWYTSVEALQRFGQPPTESRQSQQRRFPRSSRYRRSENELDRRGC
jgi:hypothetical protein